MPKRSTVKLTDQHIKSQPSPASGSAVIYDRELPGFGIRLTTGGARAFVLNYVVDRRERRLTIGRFPAWSTSAAREEARRLKRRVNLGIDPLEETEARTAVAVAARLAPTVADLFARYDAEHLPNKAARSASDDRSMWRTYILPALGEKKVAELGPSDVDALHADIGRTKPVRANRVVQVLRKALNLAIRWDWRSDNPGTGTRRNHEEKRERYLGQKEIVRLMTALASHSKRTSADAISFLLLTGARKSEALRATWDQFDLNQGVWIKPSSHTKQRRAHRTPLSSQTVALLRRRAERADGRFVFSGLSPDRPLTDVKRSWLAVCRAAGLAERVGAPTGSKAGLGMKTWKATVRLHDLRHTYASILVSRGLSLPVIGALLGHSQPQTTARYAHLLDEPLRAATEAVAEAISGTTG